VLNHDRRHFVGTAATAIAATQLGSLGSVKAWVRQMMPAAVQLPVAGDLPSLASATEWLNSPPLTAAGLRGKVVLVDFCLCQSCGRSRRLLIGRVIATPCGNSALTIRMGLTPLPLPSA